jgi:hypothetical protein
MRDMIVCDAKATGVIFPVDKKTIKDRAKEISVELEFPKASDKENLEKAYEDAYKNEIVVYERNISELSEYQFFVIPFIVPSSNACNDYSTWKREFDISRDKLCEAIKKFVFGREQK